MKQTLLYGEIRRRLTLEEKFGILRRQIDESIGRIDEYRGILHIRRHLAVCSLFKGIPFFRETRIRMLRADTKAELFDIIEQVEADLGKAENAVPELD